VFIKYLDNIPIVNITNILLIFMGVNSLSKKDLIIFKALIIYIFLIKKKETHFSSYLLNLNLSISIQIDFFELANLASSIFILI
jgi:hypothetical protein